MFSKAKVGDKVWSPAHGWGQIICSQTTGCGLPGYPIRVKFQRPKNQVHQLFSYTFGGKTNDNHILPDLYWNDFEPPTEAFVRTTRCWQWLYKDLEGNCKLTEDHFTCKSRAENHLKKNMISLVPETLKLGGAVC